MEVDPVEPPPPDEPPNTSAGGRASLRSRRGTPENLATLADIDFIDALNTLREIDDVNLVSVPDCMATLDG